MRIRIECGLLAYETVAFGTLCVLRVVVGVGVVVVVLVRAVWRWYWQVFLPCLEQGYGRVVRLNVPYFRTQGESVRQVSTAPLNSLHQSKTWRCPCVETRHVKKLWTGVGNVVTAVMVMLLWKLWWWYLCKGYGDGCGGGIDVEVLVTVVVVVVVWSLWCWLWWWTGVDLVVIIVV